ncbi:hypothetical protein E3N88_04597 [Mikania micrantha]|uniref:Gnk2-homologous domain-containing protein n=1 Tax=Mikania micrantha TaxID=192012 RepID=A0A5N6PUW5_9ASTR|nr:hypothetical protein E3N88_04597 [Mikania micrantha]
MKRTGQGADGQGLRTGQRGEASGMRDALSVGRESGEARGGACANSVALCRGDINPDVCYICLNNSIVRLQQLCPTQKGARGYYEYCLLRYSNENILGNTPIDFYVYLANPLNATNIDLFNHALWPLLSKLIDAAARDGDQQKFASGNTTVPDFQRIYGLVQCTPDLMEQECRDCLDDLANHIIRWFNGRIGGRIFVPICSIRYETRRFLMGVLWPTHHHHHQGHLLIVNV